MPTCDQQLCMLPLRLELRRVDGEVAAAKVRPASDEDPGALSIRYHDEFVENPQYWIRWYPDESGLLAPVREVTDEEKLGFRELLQAHRAEEGGGRVQARTDAFVDEVADGDADRAERIMRVHLGYRPGRLEPDVAERCAIYDREALQAILRDRAEQPDQAAGVRLGRGIYDLEHPVLDRAWRAFVERVGIVRARYVTSHFLGRGRLDEDISEPDPLDAYFKSGLLLHLLPRDVYLSTMHGADVRMLAHQTIPENARLVMAQPGMGGPHAEWIHNFDRAVASGMGLVVHREEKVEQLDAADWLIAFGLRDADTDPDLALEEILRARRSRGELSIVPQDSPTNTTGAGRTPYASFATDLEHHLRATRMRIDEGDFGETDRQSLAPPPVEPDDRLADNTLDSQILAHALDLDPAVLSEVEGAELTEQTEAGIMARFAWPLLTRRFRAEWSNTLDISDEDERWRELGRFFEREVRARGPLPVLRIGANPYGVLPVVDLRQWAPSPDGPPAEQAVERQVKRVTDFLAEDFDRFVDGVPRLDPGAPDPYERLLDVLRRTRISHRIDVRWRHEDHSRYLLCRLIRDHERVGDDGDGLDYLRSPGGADADPLPNLVTLDQLTQDESGPVELSNDWHGGPSLLHRLMSHHVYERVESRWVRNEQRARELAGAAAFLAGIPPDRLEILFVEIVDCMCFRLDAWVTALATARMRECRAVGKPTVLGVYGWLEKPGQPAASGEPPAREEFVQAPSEHQAITAALLRSAARARTGDDPFELNLSSARVREGLWYLDSLRLGHAEGELLGRRLERLIREAAGSDAGLTEVDIYALRDAFPLPAQGDGSVPVVVDGAGFLDRPGDRPAPADRFDGVARRLAAMRDAAADIAVAEAMYQFVRGNTAAAAGWLDCLDGAVPPPAPAFVRGHRSGRSGTTRLLLAVPPAAEYDADGPPGHPVRVTDPLLYSLATRVMPEFGAETIRVRFGRVGAPAEDRVEREIRLVDELALEPVDLVFGGDSVVRGRVRAWLAAAWRRGELSDAEMASLGAFPVLRERADPITAIAIDWLDHDTAPAGYISKAAMLGRLLRRGRTEQTVVTLDPAADRGLRALDDRAVDWKRTLEPLLRRAERLRAELDAIAAAVEDMIENSPALSDAFSDPFAAGGVLLRVARLDLDDALRVLPAGDDEAVRLARERARRLVDSVGERRDALDSLPEPTGSAQADRSACFRVAEALAAATGRPGSPTLLAAVGDDGEWNVDHGAASDYPLAAYGTVRPAVEEARELFGEHFELREPAPEMAGRELYFAEARTAERGAAAYIALDDWKDFVPSMEQSTSVAVHYDAPRARAPNAILLLQPPQLMPDIEWEPKAIADTLRSTLELMRLRMVGTPEVLGDNNLGRFLPWTIFEFGKFPVLAAGTRPLDELGIPAAFDYRLAEHVDENEREPPGVIAERAARPALGDAP